MRRTLITLIVTLVILVTGIAAFRECADVAIPRFSHRPGNVCDGATIVASGWRWTFRRSAPIRPMIIAW